jgi:hypothetical protein
VWGDALWESIQNGFVNVEGYTQGSLGDAQIDTENKVKQLPGRIA